MVHERRVQIRCIATFRGLTAAAFVYLRSKMAINAEIDSDNLLVNSHVAYYHSYMYKSMLNVAGESLILD